MWWRGDAVTRWCGDAVKQWRGDAVARWRGGAVTWWHGDTVTWWRSGTGQVKWLTGLVAGGKANDWLVWWQGARQMTWWRGDVVMRWRGDAVTRWRGGTGQVKWLTGLVAGGKANDWLVWWQGARQMNTKLIKYHQISVYFFEKKWLALSKRSIVSGTRSSESDTIQHLEIRLETATF